MRIVRDLVRLEDEIGQWVATYATLAHESLDPYSEGKFSDRQYELEELEQRIHDAADWASGMLPLRRRQMVS